MLPAGKIEELVRSVDGPAYDGILTRYIDSDAFEVGGKNCFYDAGPHKYGQRYTPKGGARGIYMAEGVPTALGEAGQSGLAALCPNRVATRIHLDMEVTLKRVFDLGDSKLRRRLKTTLDELRSPWEGGLTPPYTWPPTWLLGHAIHESCRFDGIRYPSAQVNRKYCVLVLTERLGRGALLTAHQPGEGLVTHIGKFKLLA